jgi:hypothetical protein
MSEATTQFNEVGVARRGGCILRRQRHLGRKQERDSTALQEAGEYYFGA